MDRWVGVGFNSGRPVHPCTLRAARFSEHLAPKAETAPSAKPSGGPVRGFDGIVHRSTASNPGFEFDDEEDGAALHHSGKFLVGTSTDVWKRFLRITEEVR